MITRNLPAAYRNRDSQLPVWEIKYAERITDVEWLLHAVCDCFGFSPEMRHQFSPLDDLAKIYRHCYPRWKFWRVGDSLELETLVHELESRMHLGDRDLFAMTLGEIIDLLSS